MTITIVTINLNNQDGLKKTIDSLRALRKCKNIHFLLQDGKSSDNSISIARKFYCEEEIYCEYDNGVYDAMNKSVYNAKGDYIIWINSGDQVVASAWYSVIDEVSASNADMIICGISIVDQNGSVIKKVLPTPHDLSKGIAHPGTFFLRDSIISHKGYNTEYQIAGDLDLILRLIKNGAKVKTINIIISLFEIGGISSNEQYWTETWRTHYKNGTIGMTTYILNIIKYYLKKSGIVKNLRFKIFSVFSSEKHVSIYNIGAKHVD